MPKTLAVTKSQLRALHKMAEEDDGPFSAGSLPIWSVARRAAVAGTSA